MTYEEIVAAIIALEARLEIMRGAESRLNMRRQITLLRAEVPSYYVIDSVDLTISSEAPELT